MSDVTESSKRALRALMDESGSSTSHLLGNKMERSPSPRHRPSSPDVVCPICLGEITNKAVTDSCLHSFCFSCLSEWSKVKPECPLCKQRFSIIYHSINSMDDYQEYRLNTVETIDLARGAHGLVARVEPFDPHIFINVAVQRATRFGYRTTMGMNRNGRTPVMFWMPPGGEVSQRRIPQILRSSPHNNTAFAATSGTSTRSASSSTRTTRASSIDFRRNVYQQNLWVRASEGDRVRESSPEFYRLNPAQTHRLVPWLTRELSVLLNVSVPYYQEHACREILSWITIYHINSYDFKRVVQSYFGEKTDHFVHEFYHFAISPFDLPAYDDHSRYTPSNAELETVAPTDDLVLENLALDINPMRIFRRPEVHDSFDYAFPSGVPRRPFGSLRRPVESVRPPPPRGGSGTANDVIVLSSDEEPAAQESGDSDSEVMIIGIVPPIRLRTPEVITLDDSGDDSDVIEIKPPTPPLIEIYGSDSNSHSHPSSSNGVAGTSSASPDAPLNQKRTARFFRPSYREYSSSSDEEFSPKKKSSKKKCPENKRPSRPLFKRFKSSKYVDPTSSESEDSDGFVKRENEEELRLSREKQQSSDEDSRPESSLRDKLDDTHNQATRHRNSREPKSSKKINGSKKRSSSSSCSKCLKPKRRLSSSSSKAKSPIHDKKRSRSNSSYSSSNCSSAPMKISKNSSVNSPISHDESGSSNSLDVDTEFNPPQGSSTTLAPNPKALSKKAIILNKRKSELSFDQLAVAGPSKIPNGDDVKKVMMQLLSGSDTDQDESLDKKESFSSFEHSDSPSSLYKMRPEGNLVGQLNVISDYYSDNSSSILSMGQEYNMPGLDAGESNGPSSSNGLPQNHNECLDDPSSENNPCGWGLGNVPTRPPSICSTSSSSSSNTSNSSHSILNVTSVDPPPPDQSNESYPELTLNPATPVDSVEEDASAVASSPPNLRRFDDASSPFITLSHSPLPSDSSSSPPSHASVTSPPRLKSIVLRVPSPSRRHPHLYPPTSSSFSSTTDEDDDY